jgi:hypothetical protein
MEDDLLAVRDVAKVIPRLTEAMHDDDALASSIQHLAGEILDTAKRLGEHRYGIFKSFGMEDLGLEPTSRTRSSPGPNIDVCSLVDFSAPTRTRPGCRAATGHAVPGFRR